MPAGQRREGAVRVRVELDKDEVPDFDACRRAGIDERALALALRREVHVNLAARAARAGLAHHPEIVFPVAADDMDRGVQAGGGKEPHPLIVSILVETGGIAGAGFIHRRVEPTRRELPLPDQQFPRPLNGFLLEIIPKTPVSQHLKKRVVIGVKADVLEIILFAAGANALLRVRGARWQTGNGARPLVHIRRALAQEEGDELVHAGVGEQKIR